MSKRDAVDLDALRPVPLAEIIKGPNREWNNNAKAPELFEQWWDKSGRVLLVGMTRKEAARAAWYACAESLGAYDDQPPQPLSRPRRKSRKQQVEEELTQGENRRGKIGP